MHSALNEALRITRFIETRHFLLLVVAVLLAQLARPVPQARSQHPLALRSNRHLMCASTFHAIHPVESAPQVLVEA